MSDQPTLFDLFEEQSLHNCQRMLGNGDIPTARQLADVLEANAEKPLPAWFIAVLVKSLRGELKRKAGRRKEPTNSLYRFAAAEYEYRSLLNWLTNPTKSLDLEGWSIPPGFDRSSGPPHELAARTVIERRRLHMSWRSFLNRVSSQK
jgi:hypothetical protein